MSGVLLATIILSNAAKKDTKHSLYIYNRRYSQTLLYKSLTIG